MGIFAICGRAFSVLAYDGNVAKAPCTIQRDQMLNMLIFISSSWKIVEELFRCYRQGASELNNILECNIPFAALDSSDIVAVESGSFCKFLLRQTPLETELSHRASEQRFDRLRGHLSSFRDDHYESTHDECYLFSCVKAWDRIAETRAFAAPRPGPLSDRNWKRYLHRSRHLEHSTRARFLGNITAKQGKKERSL